VLGVFIYRVRGGQIVNVSAAFQELKTKQYELTGKQRLMVLGVIGVIVILIFYYITTASEDVVQPNPPNANTQSVSKTLIKPDNQAALIMRDPFAAPPQVQEQKSEANPILPATPNFTPGNAPKSVIPNMQSGNLKLTGIVSTGGQLLAVIRSGDKSKSYSLNEFIGADRIVAITNDYVILAHEDKKLVLRLEASGQRGGK